MASSFFLTVSIIKSKLFSSYVPDADEILIFYNIIDLPWNFLKWKKKKIWSCEIISEMNIMASEMEDYLFSLIYA